MNTQLVTNVGLFAIGSALVAAGATAIGGNLLQGVIEIAIGLIVIGVYEILPTSNKPTP